MDKYAFFDVDHTIYDGYSTSDFYLFLAVNGYGNDVVAQDKEISELYQSGKLSYEQASRRVVQLLADGLAGLSREEVVALQNEFIAKNNKVMPWVQELFDLLHNNDYQIYLISASASPNVEAVAKSLGVKKYVASSLEVINDKYTGKIEKMLNFAEKQQAINRILSHLKRDSFKVGFGDSTGDVEMLSIMDKAFVIEPHQEEMLKLAKEKGWTVLDKKGVVQEVKAELDL